MDARYAVVDYARTDVGHVALCPTLEDAKRVKMALMTLGYASPRTFIVDTFTGHQED